MRTNLTILVVPSATAMAFLLTILALARPGFAQATLAQFGGCLSPPYSDYSTADTTNPCTAVPDDCFDYHHWFDNVLPCASDPALTVASASNGTINGNSWTMCNSGSVPGYNCTKSGLDCGTIQTYSGANCQEATGCGQVTMTACIGSTPYDCP